MFNKVGQIIYKEYPISSLSDLEILPPSLYQETAQFSDSLQELKKSEIILYQQMNLNKDDPFFQRKFSFSDMTTAQEILMNLEFIECIKYARNVVNARKLIRKYWDEKYEIGNCLELFRTESDKKISISETCSLSADENIPKLNFFVSLDETKNEPSPSPTDRNHINRFLDLHNSTALSYPQYYLFTSNRLERAPSSVTRYYISGFDVIKFILSFTYYDARDFYNRTSEKIPRFNPKRSLSGFSYELVLRAIRKLFNNFSIASTAAPDPLQVIAMLQSDSMFLHLKVRHLETYYDAYTSEPFLNMVLQLFDLTYPQVENLKKFITDNIFKDMPFIQEGLKSSCLDFMLIFDIFLRFDMISQWTPDNSHTLETFSVQIKRAKASTLAIIREYPIGDVPILHCNESGVVDLAATETAIVTDLNKNEFFTEYYSKGTASFMKEEKFEDGFPIGYDEIKDCLRWI